MKVITPKNETVKVCLRWFPWPRLITNKTFDKTGIDSNASSMLAKGYNGDFAILGLISFVYFLLLLFAPFLFATVLFITMLGVTAIYFGTPWTIEVFEDDVLVESESSQGFAMTTRRVKMIAGLYNSGELKLPEIEKKSFVPGAGADGSLLASQVAAAAKKAQAENPTPTPIPIPIPPTQQSGGLPIFAPVVAPLPPDGSSAAPYSGLPTPTPPQPAYEPEYQEYDSTAQESTASVDKIAKTSSFDLESDEEDQELMNRYLPSAQDFSADESDYSQSAPPLDIDRSLTPLQRAVKELEREERELGLKKDASRKKDKMSRKVKQDRKKQVKRK